MLPNDVGLPRFRQRFRNNIITSLQIDLCPKAMAIYFSKHALVQCKADIHSCIYGPVVEFSRWLD
jgi:hypothetical protein